MNRKNVRKLKRLVERLKSKNFDMAQVLKVDREGETVKQALEPSCGTVGCLAGWAILLFQKDKNQSLETKQRARLGYNDPYTFPCFGGGPVIEDAVEAANVHLELDYHAARALFHGRWIVGAPDGLTPRRQKNLALKELDHLLKTGEV